jgi:hypothetical protein
MKNFGGAVAAIGHGFHDDGHAGLDRLDCVPDALARSGRGKAAFEFVERDNNLHAPII